MNVGTPSRLSFPSAHATSTTAASMLMAKTTGLPLEGLRPEEVIGHVEDQQRLHAVEAESLPKFRKEQNKKALGMTEQLALAWIRTTGGPSPAIR